MKGGGGGGGGGGEGPSLTTIKHSKRKEETCRLHHPFGFLLTTCLINHKVLHVHVFSYSRTAMLNSYLISPMNSPIFNLLSPFCSLRYFATDFGVSRIIPLDMRY